VARRSALVRELRSTDREAADAVGKLRKPPAGVWAIDQVVAETPAHIAELLAAGADAARLRGTSPREQRAVRISASPQEGFAMRSRLPRGPPSTCWPAPATPQPKTRHEESAARSRQPRPAEQQTVRRSGSERSDRDLDVAGFGGVGEPEDDPSDLAAVLAPLRRRSESTTRQSAPAPAAAGSKGLERRQAERDQAKLHTAAERAREAADAKRHQADRLSDEARTAADEATIAEHAADAAEEAARAARAAIRRSR